MTASTSASGPDTSVDAVHSRFIQIEGSGYSQPLWGSAWNFPPPVLLLQSLTSFSWMFRLDKSLLPKSSSLGNLTLVTLSEHSRNFLLPWNVCWSKNRCSGISLEWHGVQEPCQKDLTPSSQIRFKHMQSIERMEFLQRPRSEGESRALGECRQAHWRGPD